MGALVYHCISTVIQCKVKGVDNMAWSFSPHAPVYYQIAERIRKGILSGEYLPGDQIPSVRQFATEATVNPNTIQRAFVELENTGLIESRGTLGRFVTESGDIIEKCREDEAKKLLCEFRSRTEELHIPMSSLIDLLMSEGNEEKNLEKEETNK